jgi:hypothetical protein
MAERGIFGSRVNVDKHHYIYTSKAVTKFTSKNKARMRSYAGRYKGTINIVLDPRFTFGFSNGFI